MNKRQIITVAGKPGSGKSTTAHGVAEYLGYSHFSSGDLFRSIARERGIDVYQANLAAEKEKEIDYAVDQRLRDISDDADHDPIVIDSRMAWHWMSNSYKVYLDLDTVIAATRILTDKKQREGEAEEIPETPKAYAKRLEDRLSSEAKRYQDLYQANPYDLQNYDLIVDTERYDAESAIELVVGGFRAWLDEG